MSVVHSDKLRVVWDLLSDFDVGSSSPMVKKEF